jgi:hypothetical protein
MITCKPVRSLASLALVLAVAVLTGPVAMAQQAGDAIAVVDGRSWAVETSGDAVPWADANDYCDTLEAGGHDDWRLATLAELEALFAASDNGVLPPAIDLADCCAWSATNLVEIPPEAKGELPDPAMGPDQYYWGLLFPDGIRYYSMSRFPDGVGLCTRDD